MSKLRWRLGASAVMLIALASCRSSGESRAQPTNGEQAPATAGAEESCAVSDTPSITAAGSTFDKTCLAARAGRPFNVELNNTDGFGHSFAVYDRPGGTQLFRGEIFTGPKTAVNQIGALQAGTYHFQCDVHPFVMQGTLRVE